MIDIPASSASAIDLVCGMTVDPAKARYQADHGGKTYYFCSDSCRRQFVADPAAFLDPRRTKPAGHAHGAPGDLTQLIVEAPGRNAPRQASEYTCPMHPEVVQSLPGSCPICGMALEPLSPATEEDLTELQGMSRRLWISAGLTVPLFVVAMSRMALGHQLESVFSAATLGWLEFALATPVVLWGGWPFFVRGWQSLARRALNMFTLIAVGTGAAYGYSTLAVVMPGLFPASLRSAHGHIDLYFEAAAVIVTLVLLGQVLELRARSRTGAAIRALLELAPKTARRIAGGIEEDVPIAQIEVGDRLRVRPGEKVPVDGLVAEGESSVNESMISGEPMPVAKQPFALVLAGTVNGTGSLVIEARRVGSQTVLAQIVEMVAHAQRSRAPIQRLADRVSAYFVPAVIVAAAATFAVWLAVGPQPKLAYALVNSVAVLIIACPCALGLATPMSIMVGVGRGAQAGVLIKDAEVLEVIERVDTLVVDKTGTLTEGQPSVVQMLPAPGIEPEELLRLAASLERASEHPLAAAVVRFAEQVGAKLADVRDFQATAGRGVRGTVDGRSVLIGSERLLAESGVDAGAGDVASYAERLRAGGHTALMVAVDGRFAGGLAVADTIKISSVEAIRELKAHGIRIVLATGDNRATAESVAGVLGIAEVHAEVLPDAKLQLIERLKADGRIVAMAGDGINDAPALAAAHVGIAMGTGTDVAMESAGVTLVRGDLRGIVSARRLSEAVMRNIRQNLFFAFAYNALGIPVAAGVLYPMLGLLLNPMLAAAAMSFSSVSVIANALRLRRLKL